MRIIEKKIESIGNERIEIALIERTSRKWIAGIILLSIIVLGLYAFMGFLYVNTPQYDWFRRLLTLVGGLSCMFMAWQLVKYLKCRNYPQERILSVEVL
jgi:hypothetical protein